VIKSRRRKLTAHVACGGHESCIRVLVEGTERKRPLGKPTLRRQNNIEMDLQDVGQGHGLDSSGSGQGQDVGACECGNETSGSINVGNIVTC
jgi:hypothetical protein